MNIFLNINLSCIVFLVFMHNGTYGQVPQRMSYQSVIRNENSKLVINTEIGIRISILQGSATGAVIYSETHQPVSNENGLITLEIGDGLNEYGVFSEINWANGPYFMQTWMDLTGGSDYTISGTSQLLSVPFALHAKTAENFSGANTLVQSIISNYLASGITAADTARWNSKTEALTGSETVFTGWDKNSADDFSGNYNDLSGKPENVSEFVNDAGYIITENDPGFRSSVAAGITSADITAWNAASVGGYNETDPLYSAWDKSSGILITRNQVTDLSFAVFEKELTGNETTVDLGFELESTSEVYINGTALPSGKWSGTGTNILSLSMEIKLYDKLKVKK